jgi:hypothetical protein
LVLEFARATKFHLNPVLVRPEMPYNIVILGQFSAQKLALFYFIWASKQALWK